MGTVSKALGLLDLFTRQRSLIGLSDFARLSGMNKATCFRMLSELQAFGFVEQVGAAREYRLGPQVLRLAGLREATVPMRDAALPVMRALSARLGETVHLSVIIGERLTMMGYAYSSAHGIKVMMEDADTLPFHATSSGLVGLAFMGEVLRERILAAPLHRLTAQTVTDAEAIRARLDQVRSTGLAESAGGFEAEVDSQAAPLFDANGAFCGALAVAAPAQRMTPPLAAAIRAALVQAAREVTKVWGGQVPPEIDEKWQSIPQDAGLPPLERVVG